jgi:glycosyltransferase involved in cell wall biosynthesis
MTSTGIRVLVLTSLFPPRPGEKHGNFVLDQVMELAAQGCDVTVMVARPRLPGFLNSVAGESKRPIDASVYAAERFQVVNARFFSLPRYLLGTHAADFISRLVNDVRAIHGKTRIDVIHAHGIPLGYAAVAAAEDLGIPSIITIHGVETAPRFDNSQAKRDQIGRMLEKANKVVLVGSPLLEYIRRYTTRTEHCAVVNNGFAEYQEIAPSTQIPRGRPMRVIAVSNYEPSKGFELLIEAVALLEPSIREQIETVLVGGGSEFAQVLSRANGLGLGPHVHHLGPLPHESVMSEVLAADIFCLPSWREAFGIMYAEAMSLGKLTVGCEGQGPSDFIRHLETGYLVAPRNVKPVAEALRWAVQHPDERDRIAEAGRSFVRGHLTWRHNASRILEIYRDAITTKAGALKSGAGSY